jgi:hypothetical protein
MSRSRDIANLLGAESLILDGAPSDLDTLNELAAAIGNDANYSSTITNAISAKAPAESPTLTGTVSLPSSTTIGDVSSTELGYLKGITSDVQTQLNNKASTSSPTFTGDVNVSNFTATGLAITYVNINSQTGTAYTLALSDAGKAIEINNAAANTLTVPANSSVAFPIGTIVDVFQTGAGQTTVAASAGVTINSTPGLKLSAQWATATLVKRGTDTWLLTGSLSA